MIYYLKDLSLYTDIHRKTKVLIFRIDFYSKGNKKPVNKLTGFLSNEGAIKLTISVYFFAISSMIV